MTPEEQRQHRAKAGLAPMERLTSGDVGNVRYTDITPSELAEKQREYEEREQERHQMRVRYPHYVPGRHNVLNLNCAGCGNSFNLRPSLCHSCLEQSLLPGAGPYRTAGKFPTPYDGDPEICGGCGGMHPYAISGKCEGTLNASQVRTRLSFYADISQMNHYDFLLKRSNDALEDAQWRFRRLAVISILLAFVTCVLGLYLKAYLG